MDELNTKILELIDKAEVITPTIIENVRFLVQMEGVFLILIGFLLGLLSLLSAWGAYKLNKKFIEDTFANDGYFLLVLLVGTVSLCMMIGALVNLLYYLNWIMILSPELYLTKHFILKGM